MPAPSPCAPEYRDFLAAEYLRTISGRTTTDPLGWLCAPSDVNEWRQSILRIRTALSDALKIQQSQNIPMPAGTGERVAAWVFKSLKVPTGKFIPHAVNTPVCKKDVANAVDFGKRGVVLLADVHCALDKGNASVPTPPTVRPPTKDLPYGSGIWYLALVVAGLGLLAYLKPKGSQA